MLLPHKKGCGVLKDYLEKAEGKQSSNNFLIQKLLKVSFGIFETLGQQINLAKSGGGGLCMEFRSCEAAEYLRSH